MRKDRTSRRTAVVEAARRIYKELGSGFVEQVYRDAMAVEFRLLGLPYEVERNIEVFYRDERVGLHRLDFIVDHSLVVELKAAAKISEHNSAQTRAYLKTTRLSAALVINFPSPDTEDGLPEVLFVSPRTRAAAKPLKLRGVTEQKKRREPRRKRRTSKPQPKQRLRSTKEHRPLGDLVWDDVTRRYVDKHPRPAVGVRSVVTSPVSREAKASGDGDLGTSIPVVDSPKD